MVGGNDNGDLVINLSKALKAEKEKNLQLESELKKLRGDGKSTTPANEPRNNKNGSDSGEKNNNTNGSNVFSLPKDK